MGKNVVQQIRDNYTLYTDLLINRKSIREKVIDISEKGRNENYLKNDKVVMEHITLPHNIILISEVKIRNYKSFKFKIKCAGLCEVPFFRYDSDGPAHRNYDENIPFEYQQIETPHFHNFNSNGISIAYQTHQLKNKVSKEALEDINFSAAHFCHEGNIRVGKEDFPLITILSKELGLTQIENDPNTGVNFL
jgi:hypothetical protein